MKATKKAVNPAQGSTAHNPQMSDYYDKDKQMKRVMQVLPPHTLVFDYGMGVYHECPTIQFFRGRRPEGIAIFRGSFQQCSDFSRR